MMGLPEPYYHDEKYGITIYLGDCLDILPELDPVDCIITDPPYMGVVKDEWDNQWETEDDFLCYVSKLMDLFSHKLKSKGSLYFFASPAMSARVEVETRKVFNVLNSLVWSKGDSRQGAAGSGIDVTALRRFWSVGEERIIFAEKKSADAEYQGALIDGNSSYWDACDSAKILIIGDYLKKEFKRAEVTNREVSALFPSKTGGLTGCVSNWINGANFPTKDQYLKIREYLNAKGDDYLRREYEDLRREYEDLRREYEDLRREYEDLRRPFNLNSSMQWGDIWTFPLPNKRTGHPCEKPVSLMSHIINTSSRADQTILDPFMGSGTTLLAAKELGRKAVGIEINEVYCEISARRLSQEVFQF